MLGLGAISQSAVSSVSEQSASCEGAWGALAGAVTATIPLHVAVASGQWGGLSASVNAATVHSRLQQESLSFLLQEDGRLLEQESTPAVVGAVDASSWGGLTGSVSSSVSHQVTATGDWGALTSNVHAVPIRLGITSVTATVSASTRGFKIGIGASDDGAASIPFVSGCKRVVSRQRVDLSLTSGNPVHSRIRQENGFALLQEDGSSLEREDRSSPAVMASKFVGGNSHVPSALTVGSNGVKHAIGSGSAPVVGFTNHIVIGVVSYVHILLRYVSGRQQAEGRAVQGRSNGSNEKSPNRVSGHGT